MKKLNELYAKIVENKILLFHSKIPGSTAATLQMGGRYSIFADFNQFHTLYDEFLAIAHEYGHCMSGATHKVASKLDVIIRHEYRADRKSVTELLPYEELKRAIEYGCREAWEISEYLDFPEAFVKLALKQYEDMGKKF